MGCREGNSEAEFPFLHLIHSYVSTHCISGTVPGAEGSASEEQNADGICLEEASSNRQTEVTSLPIVLRSYVCLQQTCMNAA